MKNISIFQSHPLETVVHYIFNLARGSGQTLLMGASLHFLKAMFYYLKIKSRNIQQ